MTATESVQRLLEAQEAPVVQQMKGGSLGKGEEVKKEKEGEGWKQQQQQEQEQGKTGKKGKKGKKSKKGKDPCTLHP